jgi:hypothetical protein
MELFDDPFNLLRGFFTFQSLLSFISGVLLTIFYYKVRQCREATVNKKFYRLSFNRSWIVMGFSLLVILFIGFKTQVTADLAENTSRELKQQVADYQTFSKQTQECLNEITNVYKQRSDLTVANEELSGIERRALADLLIQGSQVPNDLPDAERARQWESLLKKYADTVRPIQDQRTENIQEKKDNPVPDPTCNGMVKPPK